MSKSFREQLASANLQLTALTARIAELTVKAASEFDYSLVKVGVKVDAMFGRAEKKRQISGVVVAIKQQEKGADMVRIQAGEGFDMVVETVFVNNVTAVYDADGTLVAGATQGDEVDLLLPLGDGPQE